MGRWSHRCGGSLLHTPILTGEGSLVMLATPPKVLEKLQLIEHLELWLLVRALYGLRQSPMLRAQHRDNCMGSHEAAIRMRRGKTITSWWGVRDAAGVFVGIVPIYVDDYLIMGPVWVIKLLTEMIQKEWDTSELAILSKTNSVKFLGMELTLHGLYLSQQPYIEELLRSYDMKESDQSKIPVNKENAVFDLLAD